VRDPTLERVRELASLYAHPFKAIIHERLGDGVMSAVDAKVCLQIKKSEQHPWETMPSVQSIREGMCCVDLSCGT
jgi:cyanate lyase